MVAHFFAGALQLLTFSHSSLSGFYGFYPGIWKHFILLTLQFQKTISSPIIFSNGPHRYITRFFVPPFYVVHRYSYWSNVRSLWQKFIDRELGQLICSGIRAI